MIPIIYIHIGKVPEYLVVSMKQAALHNKEVILLTDTDYKNDKIRSFQVSRFNQGVDAFESVYKHMSSNSADFEKICIKRWFILRNFATEQNIEAFYYSDSDVMIYEDLSKIYEHYKDFDASYTLTDFQENYRWTASACCSYWKKNTIGKFCDFVMQMYSPAKIGKLEEKWNYHVKNSIGGGICDMTLLYLFSKEISFFPLSKVVNDQCFDQNMLDSENYFKNEYSTVKRTGEERIQKEILWKDGLPFGFNLLLQKQIRFVVLTEYAKLLGIRKSPVRLFVSRLRSIIKR